MSTCMSTRISTRVSMHVHQAISLERGSLPLPPPGFLWSEAEHARFIELGGLDPTSYSYGLYSYGLCSYGLHRLDPTLNIVRAEAPGVSATASIETIDAALLCKLVRRFGDEGRGNPIIERVRRIVMHMAAAKDGASAPYGLVAECDTDDVLQEMWLMKGRSFAEFDQMLAEASNAGGLCKICGKLQQACRCDECCDDDKMSRQLAELDTEAEAVHHKNEDQQGIRVGASVRICGLISRPELNGRHGTVLLFNDAKGRYVVKLDDGKTELSLKPECLDDSSALAVCAHCGCNEASRLCSACRNVRYCSRECQVGHDCVLITAI